MKLFLTIEAQSDAIESGLREILDCVNAKLSFMENTGDGSVCKKELKNDTF